MCSISYKMFVKFVFLFLIHSSVAHLDKEAFRTLLPFRECITQKFPGLCLKERALDALNETIMSDKPLVIMDAIQIARNPKYDYEKAEDNLPLQVESRSSKISDILYNKIEEFFKSRVISFNMAQGFDEARGKGGGGGGGGGGKKGKGGGMMMMMAMGGAACMIAQLFMGKIAFLAGSALVIAKIALFISGIIGLKKLSGGGGGGGGEHVVYAAESHGGGGGGGGWHRSIVNNDAQNIAYRAHITEATGY